MSAAYAEIEGHPAVPRDPLETTRPLDRAAVHALLRVLERHLLRHCSEAQAASLMHDPEHDVMTTHLDAAPHTRLRSDHP